MKCVLKKKRVFKKNIDNYLEKEYINVSMKWEKES